MRGRTMRNITTATFLTLLLVAGCGETATGRAVVTGTGEAEFLKLRAGPGLGYKATLGLPDGTHVTRGACVTELGQLWCKVSLAAAPAITGYVAADYLADR
jgi:uncharacterized protein YraI